MKNTENNKKNVIYVYLSVVGSVAICLNWIRKQNYEEEKMNTSTYRSLLIK